MEKIQGTGHRVKWCKISVALFFERKQIVVIILPRKLIHGEIDYSSTIAKLSFYGAAHPTRWNRYQVKLGQCGQNENMCDAEFTNEGRKIKN